MKYIQTFEGRAYASKKFDTTDKYWFIRENDKEKCLYIINKFINSIYNYGGDEWPYSEGGYFDDTGVFDDKSKWNYIGGFLSDHDDPRGDFDNWQFTPVKDMKEYYERKKMYFDELSKLEEDGVDLQYEGEIFLKDDKLIVNDMDLDTIIDAKKYNL